jgi:hypothetical protein
VPKRKDKIYYCFHNTGTLIGVFDILSHTKTWSNPLLSNSWFTSMITIYRLNYQNLSFHRRFDLERSCAGGMNLILWPLHLKGPDISIYLF